MYELSSYINNLDEFFRILFIYFIIFLFFLEYSFSENLTNFEKFRKFGDTKIFKHTLTYLIYLLILHVEKNSTCKPNAKYFAFLSFSIEERKSNEIKSLGITISLPLPLPYGSTKTWYKIHTESRWWHDGGMLP